MSASVPGFKWIPGTGHQLRVLGFEQERIQERAIVKLKNKVKVLDAQLCLTLCDPMDCSPAGSSVHGIFQARILEWVVISFFRGSSWARNWTQVSHVVGRFFTAWATREAHKVRWKQVYLERYAFHRQKAVWESESSSEIWDVSFLCVHVC